MPKVALILVLAAVIAGAVLLVLSMGADPGSDLTVPVRRGEFVVSVETKGRIEADNALRVEVRGRGNVITYLAPEGTFVKKDDVIARLDDGQTRDRLLTCEFDLKASEAGLADRQKRTAVRRQEMEADIATAEADLSIKRTQFERMKALPLPDDVARSTHERDYRRSVLEIARQDFETLKDLEKRGSLIFSKDDMRDKELAFVQATGDLEKAENDLSELLTGAQPAQLEATRRDLAKAELTLEEAKRRLPERVRMLEADVRAGEADVDKMKARRDDALKDLGLCEVKSPGEGVLLYRTLFNRPIEQGVQFWHAAHLFDIADLGQLVVHAKVSESEFARLKVGQAVEVRAVTVPDRVFKGEVREVAKVARDKSEGEVLRQGAGRVGIQAFDVLVRLSDANQYLRPNVEAELTIFCERAGNALSIPIDAVFYQGDRACVRVLDGRRLRIREVALGVQTNDRVQVVKGLSAGDRVSLRPPEQEGGR